MRKILLVKIVFLSACMAIFNIQASDGVSCESIASESIQPSCICVSNNEDYRIKPKGRRPFSGDDWKIVCEYVKENNMGGEVAFEFTFNRRMFSLEKINPNKRESSEEKTDVAKLHTQQEGDSTSVIVGGGEDTGANTVPYTTYDPECPGSVCVANALENKNILASPQTAPERVLNDNSGREYKQDTKDAANEVKKLDSLTNFSKDSVSEAINNLSSLSDEEKQKILGRNNRKLGDDTTKNKEVLSEARKVLAGKVVSASVSENNEAAKNEMKEIVGTADGTEAMMEMDKEALAHTLDTQDIRTGSFQSSREYLANNKQVRNEVEAQILGGAGGCRNILAQFSSTNVRTAENTSRALDLNFPKEDYGVNSCQRYTKDNYFQTVAHSIGTAEQFNRVNICADLAKLQGSDVAGGTACQAIASNLASCSYVEDRVISCPKAAFNRFLQGKPNQQGITPALIDEFVSGQSKKLADQGISELDYKNYLSELIQNNTNDDCNVECNDFYKTKAKIGNMTGFAQCLQAVDADQAFELVHHCIAYKEVAKLHFDGNKFESIDGRDNKKQSFDGRFTCERISPFAADYRACKRLVTTYDAAMVGEQALTMSEGVQRSIREANSYERLAKAQAGGKDIQTLGLDVVKDSAKTNEDMATQRAVFYSTQAATLTAFLVPPMYPTMGSIAKYCEKSGLRGQLCENAIDFAERSGTADQVFFPNKGTRNQFWGELIQAAGKSAVAWIQKNQYDKQQRTIAKVKESMTPEESDSGFDIDPSYCQRYPNSNECRGSGNRRNVDGFNGGGINVGSVGNNDYSFGNDGVGEYNESRDLPSASTISDISSMLGEGGEKGSNDFNKVAAPELSRGGGAGGGGGGPSGGGGAAGLSGGSGGAAQGAGAEGDGSVGITKSSGRYAGTGGAAYTAGTARRLGQDQKVDNPFSSLFGAKNSARDVASQVENDIAPAKIGLFETISSRYQKVNNDKRLLDSNVK